MDLDIIKNNNAENRVMSATDGNRVLSENRGNSVFEENRGINNTEENRGDNITSINKESREVKENQERPSVGENRVSKKEQNNAGKMKGNKEGTAEQGVQTNKATGNMVNGLKNQRKWRVSFNERANLKVLRNQITKMLT